MNLAENWRQRRRTAALHRAASFADRGLMLGRGTVLLPFTPGLPTGCIDPVAHDRLLSLLAVAAGGRIARGACDAILPAMRCWVEGDRALAAIRLALAPLPRVGSDEAAHPLFLAEVGLDAGLTPRELLAELGYAALVPLLKDYRTQPRVPPGSGRASGRWTDGAGGFEIGYDPAPTSGAVKPPAVPAPAAPPPPAKQPDPPQEAPSLLTPVFLAPRPEERTNEDPKLLPDFLQPESPTEAILHGHPLSLISPFGKPIPFMVPLPVPGPDTQPDKDDDDGPACPPMRNDRGGGGGPGAQTYEALIAALVNPSSPTPKKTPTNPDIKSQAYYLPQPQMKSGETALDDCKRTAEPSSIPNIKKGTMVEIKSPGATEFLRRPTTRGYSRLKRQLDMQDDAVRREGKGRLLLWCVGTEREVEFLKENHGRDHPNTTFQICHP